MLIMSRRLKVIVGEVLIILRVFFGVGAIGGGSFLAGGVAAVGLGVGAGAAIYHYNQELTLERRINAQYFNIDQTTNKEKKPFKKEDGTEVEIELFKSEVIKNYLSKCKENMNQYYQDKKNNQTPNTFGILLDLAVLNKILRFNRNNLPDINNKRIGEKIKVIDILLKRCERYKNSLGSPIPPSCSLTTPVRCVQFDHGGALVAVPRDKRFHGSGALVGAPPLPKQFHGRC